MSCSILLFALLPQTSPGDPVSFMNQVYKALRKGNLAKAEAAFITPTDERLSKKLKKSIDMTSTTMQSGELVMKAVFSRVKGNWAVVVSRIETKNRGKKESIIRDEFMLKQKGKWRVVPEALRSDPAVRPLLDDDMKSLFKWYRANVDDLRKKHLKR